MTRIAVKKRSKVEENFSGSVKERKGTSHTAQLERLARVEGQIRGVARMVEEKRYCLDILIQIKAVVAAMKTIESNILDEHLQCCIAKAIASGDEEAAEEALNEVTLLLKNSSR